MTLFKTVVVTVLAIALTDGVAGRGSISTDQTGELLVTGHRGASGYRPEHTLASYELAIALVTSN